jgi:hypothetical protein
MPRGARPALPVWSVFIRQEYLSPAPLALSRPMQLLETLNMLGARAARQLCELCIVQIFPYACRLSPTAVIAFRHASEKTPNA